MAKGERKLTFRLQVKQGRQLDEKLVFPPNRTAQEVDEAKTEVKNFVKLFLEHLIERDLENGGLDVFCRVDVGIYESGPDMVSFFVNEVERGITTSFWGRDGAHAVGIVRSTLVEPLKCWIAKEKAKFAARD